MMIHSLLPMHLSWERRSRSKINEKSRQSKKHSQGNTHHQLQGLNSSRCGHSQKSIYSIIVEKIYRKCIYAWILWGGTVAEEGPSPKTSKRRRERRRRDRREREFCPRRHIPITQNQWHVEIAKSCCKLIWYSDTSRIIDCSFALILYWLLVVWLLLQCDTGQALWQPLSASLSRWRTRCWYMLAAWNQKETMITKVGLVRSTSPYLALW